MPGSTREPIEIGTALVTDEYGVAFSRRCRNCEISPFCNATAICVATKDETELLHSQQVPATVDASGGKRSPDEVQPDCREIRLRWSGQVEIKVPGKASRPAAKRTSPGRLLIIEDARQDPPYDRRSCDCSLRCTCVDRLRDRRSRWSHSRNVLSHGFRAARVDADGYSTRGDIGQGSVY